MLAEEDMSLTIWSDDMFLLAVPEVLSASDPKFFSRACVARALCMVSACLMGNRLSSQETRPNFLIFLCK